jgi:3-oxoadipate enol-lactonase
VSTATPVSVAYDLDGPPGAPVVVLSNSIGSTRELWEPQVEALRQRARVLRYDMRGHGASPVPAGPYTVEGLAVDLLALLDRLHVERALLAGISLGGAVSVALAARAPERVERLAVICSSADFGPPRAWRERAATVRAEGVRALAESVPERWFTPAFATARPELAAAARRMVGATSPEGYAACCEALAAVDLRPALARVEAPTLVIGGEQDPSTPPSHARELAAGIAAARLELLAPAAHMASVEQPEAVTRLLLEHFRLAPAAPGDPAAPGGAIGPSRPTHPEESR